MKNCCYYLLESCRAWFLYLIILLTVFLAGCSKDQGEFESINFTEFNQRIQSDLSITTPEELMKRYYVFEEEGSVNISATKEGWFGESYRIVLVHENVLDDSMADFQVVMYAEKISGGAGTPTYWRVGELKKIFVAERVEGMPTGA